MSSRIGRNGTKWLTYKGMMTYLHKEQSDWEITKFPESSSYHQYPPLLRNLGHGNTAPVENWSFAVVDESRRQDGRGFIIDPTCRVIPLRANSEDEQHEDKESKMYASAGNAWKIGFIISMVILCSVVTVSVCYILKTRKTHLETQSMTWSSLSSSKA